jgi:hypothetical protein
MTTANENLKRADLALADLSANGGLLSPEQTNTFLDLVIDQPTILKQVRQVRMPTPTMKINKIGLSGRLLRAASQSGGQQDNGTNGRYLPANQRSAPTTSQIEMSTKEVIAEVRIPYEVLEDNIEGDKLEEHIMRLIAAKTSLDLEELALHGDTANATDAFLALHNGWLKRATAHVVDNANAGPNDAMITTALLAMPQQYLRYLPQMRAFISQANKIKFQASRIARQTALGDASVTGNLDLVSQGLKIEEAPMMAADLGATGGVGRKGLITNPQNLIWGVQRQITIETDKDIRSREYIIVLTMRVALNVEDSNAVVKLINV